MRENNFRQFSRSLSTALFVMLISLLTVSAQSDFSDKVVLELSEGKSITFQPETVSIKPNSSPSVSFKNLKQQAIITRERRIHRVLFDEANNVLFGYNIIIENSSKPNSLSVSFQPLVPELAQTLRLELFPNASLNESKMRVLTLARTSSTQNLVDGAAISLDLLTSQQLGLKITDRLRFSVRNSAEVPVRDFSLDDFELAMTDSTLTADGELLGETSATRQISGSLLWFYLPNEGLYLFSLTPREGYDFRKSGKVYGNTLEFTARGKNYRWTSSENVLNIDGAYSVWVLNEPNFVPAAVSFSAQTDDKPRKSAQIQADLGDFVKTLDKPKEPRTSRLESIGEWLQMLLFWRDSIPKNKVGVQSFTSDSTKTVREINTEIQPLPTVKMSSSFRIQRLKSGGTTRIENILPKR